jgi:hypothetical protein
VQKRDGGGKQMKFHKESIRNFLGGCFGKVFNQELMEYQLYLLEKGGGVKLETSLPFFDETAMEYEDGDVKITITLTIEKICGETKCR